MAEGDIPAETDDEICSADLTLSPQLSGECKDLLRKCLDIDPDTRISLASLINHPWLCNPKDCTGCSHGSST